LNLTDYQAKYFAHELTRRFPPDSVEKITVAFAGAQVDLNPHQIDAALFAFKSPLSKGALLADEVGLGKTIEAGLVLSQKWAERKRRILVITPSNLRKQWYQELTEKFFLPCRLLETKSYNADVKQGELRPFQAPEIIICSYHFAKNKAVDVQAVPWDLVVIDEAHRLRNVYKTSNVIANTLKLALAGKDKLLLTATPLQGPGVSKVELTLLKPGWVREPYETVFGIIPLKEISGLYALHGKRLIAANIRGYKGSTEVNDQIIETVREEPQHFFYLNNGLTAFCERLEVHNLDRADPDAKRITAYNLSIVNGAQTLGSLTNYFSGEPQVTPQGFAFLKIISLERCPDDRQFADRITRCTNLQNQIGSREFVALDEQQEMIANQLTLTGVAYHYKTDCEQPASDEFNFPLDEATTACACLDQQRDCDFCARVLANRQSLWSMDEIYPPEELMRSRYARVFRADRSARTIWRAVQTQRLVIAAMQGSARASNGIRKMFFENARWLVLNLVFLKLHSENGEQLTLSQTEKDQITRKTIEVAEILWNACESIGFVSRRTDSQPGYEIFEQPRHFRSIFSAAADCRQLRDKALSLLARAE